MSAPAAETTVNVPVGETLSVPERLIVAPRAGIFRGLDGHVPIHGGDVVTRGDAIGDVQSLGASTPVQSPFDGVLVAFLAFEGERVRQGQPLAWLRCIASSTTGPEARQAMTGGASL